VTALGGEDAPAHPGATDDLTAEPHTADPGHARRRAHPGQDIASAARSAQGAIGAIAEKTDPTAAVEARDRLFRRMLAYSDLLSALVALTVTLTLLGEDSVKVTMLAVLPLILIAAKTQGLYDRDELVIRKSTLDEAPQLFQLTALYTLLVWLLDHQLVEGGLGSAQVVALWVTLFGLTFGGRVLARRLALRLTDAERCLFIGDSMTYGRLQAKVADATGVELAGRMSLQRVSRQGSRSHTKEELRELIAWTNVHRVIIEPQALPAEEMHELVRAAKGVGVRVSLLPRVLDVVGTSVVFDDLQGMTVLGVRRFRLTRSSMLLKRAFDLVGATLMLIVAAPLLAAIAVAIKYDSHGSVLFRQVRVGRDGKRFRICKFRTMTADAEERKEGLRARNECTGGLFKIADDPRVTRVGRLLRRTSLDEMPQLFNVLAGSMSLVGPRPLIADEDDQIKGYDRHRLALTPGMTGPWQILGPARVPLQEMVKLDHLYVAGWTLWTDLKILIRTVPYMLGRRGV
jgi:exopolysaccharide biosynthesis polyprenyl glycosylphosphotransferase